MLEAGNRLASSTSQITGLVGGEFEENKSKQAAAPKVGRGKVARPGRYRLQTTIFGQASRPDAVGFSVFNRSVEMNGTKRKDAQKRHPVAERLQPDAADSKLGT